MDANLFAEQSKRRSVSFQAHSFQADARFTVRCMQCGQTAANFRSRGCTDKCVIPEILRVLEPSDEDQFAVLYWPTGANRFFATSVEADEFICPTDALGRRRRRRGWIGPFPLKRINAESHTERDCLGFADYTERKGPLRRADFGVERAWGEMIASPTFDSRDLIRCYLRGRTWNTLESEAVKMPGHFLTNLADPDPYRQLLAAACDFSDLLAAGRFSLADTANVFTSAQMFHYFAVFAGNDLASLVPDSDAVERAISWIHRDFSGYGLTLERLKKTSASRHDSSHPDLQGSVSEDSAKRFQQRTHWLRDRLKERGWDKYDVERWNGPDHKTVQKLLEGLPVQEGTLDKLIRALSQKYRQVERLDIPAN